MFSQATKDKLSQSGWTSWLPQTIYTQLFLLTTLLESTIDIGIEAALLDTFEGLHGLVSGSDPVSERSALPVYLSIFVLAHIFQVALSIDAIQNKNTIQIIGLCLFNALFLLYAIIQIQEIRQAFTSINKQLNVLINVIPIVISVTEIIFLSLSWKLYREFGWQVYKQIGADRRVKKMFLHYQVFICILKFDYFFFVCFSLQFVLLVLNQGDIERWLTLAAAPLTLAVLVSAYYAVRNEVRWLMTAFIGWCVVGGAYFTFKLYRIYQGKAGAYHLVFKSLTVFSAFSLVLLCATFAVAIICLGNFDRGLKQHMTSRKPVADKTELDGRFNHLGSSISIGRMSID
ncbi:uncharacterized protein L969DRAFT_104872 [Mixia osmundae IAM 14324]|uniref:Uncharacterized protein n=1 Tax=Mixia osmundae (strain CBS 9802 / IAM 14324 / JCM 22182 / KY 12970) TaxID=764103 RepID=G7EA45_MIXOS|nr:uncharacterized protein L969DRAFT_104872 [Mixia osmundae IAM 14324]KEI37602.1 hypothetical protein L969DRAFT_104872 [Mixia osmundae IAM 14324]GAA99705.1 hypothetical protein E5Q_06408 [Mixia osmundae IAM 14324]